eukprot:6693975-Pyramimonas_sp.AAC.2
MKGACTTTTRAAFSSYDDATCGHRRTTKQQHLPEPNSPSTLQKAFPTSSVLSTAPNTCESVLAPRLSPRRNTCRCHSRPMHHMFKYDGRQRWCNSDHASHLWRRHDYVAAINVDMKIDHAIY